MINEVRDRVIASLLGGMIGDALGVPFETLTRVQILEATNNKGVDTFYPTPVGHRFHNRGLPARTVSDDTQLSFAVANSLIEALGYDQVSMAWHHVKAMDESTMGWGGTTREAVKELELFFESIGEAGRSPCTPAAFSKPNRGGGNAICMKVAPLAIYHGLSVSNILTSPELLWYDVRRLGRLTHTVPDAFLTAYALALAVGFVVKEPITSASSGKALLQTIIDLVTEAEKDFPGQSEGVSTAAQLERMLPMIGSVETIYREITPSFSAITSGPYALGVFLSIPTDFKRAVLTAVNDGGDCDTTGCMVGFLSGANNGTAAIPLEYATASPDFQRAYEIGGRLYEL